MCVAAASALGSMLGDPSTQDLNCRCGRAGPADRVHPMGKPTVDSLRSIPLFAQLEDPALDRVADLATEFSVPAGHVLIESGHPGLGVFIVEEGTVAVELGDQKTIELGPGESFGELSVLTDHARTARVQAVGDVTCLAIRRDDFASLLEEEPRIALVLLRVLAERLAGAT